MANTMYDAPSFSSKRHCIRCGEEVHMSAEAQPHLCADIVKRLARREKQVQAVINLLVEHSFYSEYSEKREVAEDIVKKLSQMGVTED